MSTPTCPDALRAFAHRVKEVFPAEVPLLETHPCEADNENVHVAIVADVDDDREAKLALAQAVEDTNLEPDFDSLIVYPVGQPENRLAALVHEEGVRFRMSSSRARKNSNLPIFPSGHAVRRPHLRLLRHARRLGHRHLGGATAGSARIRRGH